MAKASESTLADKINSTGLLGSDGEAPAAPARGRETARAPARRAPEPEPEDDLEDDTDPNAEALEDLDEAEPIDETDEEPDQDEDDDESWEPPAAKKQIAALKEDIAELKGMLRARADSTGDGEGSAGPKPSPGKINSAFTKIREKIAANKEKWGELIDDIGLTDLIDDLDAERTARTKAETDAKEHHRRQTEEAQINAANNVHKTINRIVRGDQDLMKVLGLGKHETLERKFLDRRVQIMTAAAAKLQANPNMTEDDAIASAVEYVTNRKPKSDQLARDRNAMRRPMGGGSTAKAPGKETSGNREAKLAARWDSFQDKVR